MTPPYHPPVKRSIEIAGHKTSISLEPLFWDLLKQAAQAEALPISALVARIRWWDWAPACAGVTVEGFAKARRAQRVLCRGRHA